MAVVFHAAAAQRRARQAQPAEIHILSVSLGLRASLYLEPIPPPSEIHAAALLCLLRGAQQWDRACAPKKLKKKKEKKEEEGKNQERYQGREKKEKEECKIKNATSHSEAQRKVYFFCKEKETTGCEGLITLNLLHN